MPRMVLLMLVDLVLGWQKSSEITDVIVGLARFSTVFRPFFGCCVTVEVEVWSRAELLSSAAGGCCTERLRAQFSSPMRRAAESQLSCDSCVYHNSQQVLINARQVLNWPLDLCSTQFSQPPPVNHLTCTTQQQSSILISFLKVRLNFFYFWKDNNRLKSDGKISEISQNEQEIWLRIFFKT